jgi:hypothetical protein
MSGFCLTVAVVSLAMAGPPRRVVVTGEFHADGSCAVFRDGAPVFVASDRPRTRLKYDESFNVVPDSEALFELACGSKQYPMDDRYVMILFGVPRSQPVGAGTWAIVTNDSLLARGVAGGPPRQKIAASDLSDSRPQASRNAVPMELGVTSDSGSLVLEQLDTRRTVGRFRYIGHAK